MPINLSFHGAAGTVTGSKYLVAVNEKRILIDCGMFQGARELRLRNWNSPPFAPASLKAVVLTHGHIDHVGYLPKMVREGFGGPVYATPPTIDISNISLLDTAHLQMEDAEYRNRNKLSRHPVALPLFTTEDVEHAVKHLRARPYNQWTQVGDEFRFRYHDAGHILGAAGVELEINNGARKVTIFFSGDVGRYGNPLTNNPSEPPQCDYLVCESTYGGRIHPPEDPDFEFAGMIEEVVKRRSILLIPAFAVGRTQQIIYLVNRLVQHHRIPPIDIHVDSPMAIAATGIYEKYQAQNQPYLNDANSIGDLLDGKHVFLHPERSESKQLNRLRGPAIILSSSGMMTGGRILHHLMNRLPDPKTLMALVGYMAEGTLGRRLMDGEKEVYIHKTLVPVRAKIIILQGLSGHADYFELLHWLEPIKGKPRMVFVTHGELSQSEAMAAHLKEERNWSCTIPSLDQTVSLS